MIKIPGLVLSVVVFGLGWEKYMWLKPPETRLERRVGLPGDVWSAARGKRA